MFIDNATGNVGIGTTSPSAPLHVKDSSQTGYGLILDASSYGGRQWVLGDGVTTPVPGTFELRDINSSATRLSVTSSGNVGIGTTNASYRLDVNGTVNAHSFLINGTSLGNGNVTGSGTTGYIPQWQSDSLLNNSVIYQNGTNIGIGTTAPAALLHINASNTNGAFRVDNTTGDALFVVNSSTNMVGIGMNNPRVAVDFNVGSGSGTTGETAGLRLHDGTNLGSNSPRELLLGVNGVSNGYGYIQAIYPGASTYRPLNLNPNGGTVIINGSGSSTSPSTFRYSLEVGGSVQLRGAGSNTELSKIGFGGAGAAYTGKPAYVAAYADNGGWASGMALTFNTVRGADISATNGLERMRIASNGLIGMGTSAPTALVEINGTNVANNLSLNVNNTLYVNASTSNVGIGTANPTSLLHLMKNGSPDIRIEANPTGSGSPSISFIGGSPYIDFWGGRINSLAGHGFNYSTYSNLANDYHAFFIGPTEALRIANTTNVGINTTNPTSTLHVVGDINVTGNTYLNNLNIAGVTLGGGQINSTSDVNVGRNLNVANNLTVSNNVLFVDNLTGRVGIGTTTPGQKLQVVQSSNPGNGAPAVNIYTLNNYTVNGSGQISTYPVGLVSVAGNGAVNLPNWSEPTGYGRYADIGILGGANGGSNAENAYGVIGRATGTSTGTNLYGGYFQGYTDNGTFPYPNIYGVFGSAIGVTNDITYGGYFNASGGTTNYGIYANGDKNYFGGNVGINTTSPTGVLHVSAGGQSNALVVNATTGNVGIGTASPSYKLDIASSATSDRGINIIMTGTGIVYGVQGTTTGAGTTNYAVYGDARNAASNFAFYGDHGILFNRDSVGINTESPSTKVEINGTFMVNQTSSQNIPAFYVGSNGRVGINTTSPNALLEVNGGPTATDTNLLVFGNVPQATYGALSFDYNGASGGTVTRLKAQGGVSPPPVLALSNNGNDIVSISYNDTTFLRTAPTTTLGVPYIKIGGSQQTSGGFETIGFGYSNDPAVPTPAEIGFTFTSLTGNTKGDLVFATRDVTTATAATERVRITSGGNVGIGTVAPTATLNVVASEGVVRVNATTASGQGFDIASRVSGNTPFITIGHPDRTQFMIRGTNGTRANYTILGGLIDGNGDFGVLYINSSNSYVGIGTASPAEKLHVLTSGDIVVLSETTGTGSTAYFEAKGTGGNMDMYYTGPTAAAAHFQDRGGIAANGATSGLDIRSDAGDVRIYTGGNAVENEKLRILSGGNVGINTATPTQKLDVNGSVNVTGNIYYGGNLTAYGADFAEMMFSAESVAAGDVVCLNDKMQIVKCTAHGQTSVAGVVSAKPTITGNAANGNVAVGIVGIVKTKVTGKVNRFDMLTTSSKAGYAEKATVQDFGSIIGKAMEPCSGECVINVLVGLR